MKKYLIVFSLIIISLLMFGSASASQDYNTSDDTVLAEQTFNIDEEVGIDDSDILKQEEASDEVICENQNNQTTDILTKDNTNSTINQDLITYSENENSSIISDDVIKSGDNTINLIGNEESGNYNFSDLYNNVIGYITSSDVFKWIKLLGEVSGDDVNYTTFIYGLNQIIDSIEINYTKIIDSIKNTTFINDFNITKITNEVFGNFNFNISDIISFNSTVAYDSLKNILNEFNITNTDVLNLFDDIKTSFNLNTTDAIDNNISDIKNLNNLNLTRIFELLSDVMDYNNLTFNNLNFTKFSLNSTDVIVKLLTSKVNSSNIENAFNNLLKNFVSINITKISSALDVIKISDGINEILSAFSLNTTSAYDNLINLLNGISINITDFAGESSSNLTISDIINIVSNFTNGSSFNLTDFIKNVKEFNFTDFINNTVKDLNISKINDTLNKFISHFIINTTIMQNGFDGIVESIKVNETIFMNGTSKILNATKIYVTGIIDKISKILDELDFNKTSIDALIKNIGDSINIDYLSMIGGLSKVMAGLNVFASDFGESIKDTTANISESAKSIYNKVSDYLSNLFKSNSSGDVPQQEVVTPPAESTKTVKLGTSKITAPAKTFKKSVKIKKYTITLKSGKKAIKKVKVTLKINGKTYSATTNSKGKATFNIKKLTKKGKHTAVIKFKGNNLYKSTTKKVKITIK